MTLEQATVLAKEITLGLNVHCVIYAHVGIHSVIAVPTLAISGDLADEICAMARTRGHGVTKFVAGIRIR